MARMSKFFLLLLLMTAMFVGCSQAAEQAYKKDVVIGHDSKITSFDPLEVSNIAHAMIFTSTHDTLVAFDDSRTKVVPHLAESWELADDRITWTFHLRKGVLFHNGAELTADDVVYTFERGKTPGTVASSRMIFQYVDTIKAVDKYTVEMKLFSPNMDWLAQLTAPHKSIISKRAMEEDSLRGGRIGTGAWKHVDREASDIIKFARNKDYWLPTSPTETLTIRYIPESSARVIALQTGEIDFCVSPDSSEYNFIKDDPNLELVLIDSTSLVYWAFNSEKEPVNDINVRHAIAHAINLEEVKAGAYEGYGKLATNFWGWNQYGFNPNIPGYKYDLDLAKEYLAKAGYPNGGLTIGHLTNGTERVVAAQIIQEQLRKIGVELVIEEVDSAALTAMCIAGDFQTTVYGAGFMFAPDDARRYYTYGSSANRSFQNNARIHELMNLSIEEADTQKRLDYLHEWQKIQYDECYILPLLYAVLASGINKDLTGVIYNPDGTNNFTNIAVAVK